MKDNLILSFLLIVALLQTSTAYAEFKCEPTPEQFLGNSYIPNAATMKTDVGKGLVMQGHVLSAADCGPVAGAMIEHWQAGDSGKYESQLRAITSSLADGSYRFETEWPNINPPHIHFIVTAENHARLVTQWIPDGKTDKAMFNLVLKQSTTE